MMKKIFLSCLVAVMTSVGIQAQDKQLVVLHTNDTHSTIMPLNPNLADKNVAGYGGYIRRLRYPHSSS